MPEPQVHTETMLIASIAALALGPALHWLAERARHAYAFLDGFVVVAVLGLALLEIVPLGISLAGWPAIVAVAVGLMLPNLFERHMGSKRTHAAATWVVLGGMAFHAFTDGLAIAGSHVHADSHALEWAVILHRVPVGLAVWWMVLSSGERKQWIAALVLVLIAAATLGGYGFAGSSAVFENGATVGLLEAFVGGLLLHVVSHGLGQPKIKPKPETEAPSSGGERLAGLLPGLGGLTGLGVVLGLFVVPHLDEGAGQATLTTFWELLLESAPALLIAYGVAGLLGEVLGEAPARWLRRGRAGGQTLRGVIFGLPLPLCSCGVVPVYRSLVTRGVPATAALAFLVATPELGLDAILLSVPLLGGSFTIVRVVVAFILALTVGWVVGGWTERRAAAAKLEAGETEAESPEPKPDTRTLAQKLGAGMRVGYGTVLDSTGPWILVGLLLAAFVQPWVDADSLTRLNPFAQVGAFALVGLPIYVCATGATPLVAVLIAKGLSPGAALAFLLTGPATNATTFGVIEQVHGRKTAVVFVATMISAVVALGVLVNFILPDVASGSASAHAHEDHGIVALGSALILGGLFVVSLVRQGPRRFLGRLWEQGGHSHDHGDHDGHDHGDHDGHDHDDGDDDASVKDAGSCCAH